MMHAASVQKKLSPKFSVNMRKKGPLPRVAGTQKKKNGSPKVDTRAHWNAGLEKALVDLLHEHNNDYYRGQNGWSLEAWNRICKLFNEKFSHIKFTKVQIQDKKDLKRDYKLLKQAKGQSGSHWNEKLCRIEASPPIWANIITSFPKAKKFQNKSFPLFDALGELYDGHTAEGNLSFTSVDPFLIDLTQGNVMQEEEAQNDPFGPPLNGTSPDRRPDVQHNDDDDEEDLRIVEQPSATSSAASIRDKRVASARNKDSAASGEKAERIGHKQKQDGVVLEMMGRFLEKKEKQTDAENAFSLPVCISVVDGMDDLPDDEKVEAYDLFKDEQNRFIFMTAKEPTHLKWLRKKIQRQG